MKSQYKLTSDVFIKQMKETPLLHGYGRFINVLPLTKGNLTLYNSEDRIMQVMPFRSRNERKELFKRAHNIKGVASIGLVFFSS